MSDPIVVPISSQVSAIAARLRELTQKATPRPWTAERARSYDDFVHWSIRTVEKLAAHPWSPRCDLPPAVALVEPGS